MFLQCRLVKLTRIASIHYLVPTQRRSNQQISIRKMCQLLRERPHIGSRSKRQMLIRHFCQQGQRVLPLCIPTRLDELDVVNLRMGGVMGPSEESIEEPLTVLAELKRQGLIRHLGLSNVNADQLAEAQAITEIVCVQNFYNVAHCDDDGFVDDLARRGIAYVPFFPLGGFTPLQSSELDAVAAALQATPMQVALAWLLQRSPNILLIPGTSSVEHLRENLSAAALQLPAEMIAGLDAIGGDRKAELRVND